jgi:hypothetical protein
MRSIITTCACAERLGEVALNLDARSSLRGHFRQQFLRPAQHHPRAQLGQQQHVAARHAAMQNVANDADRHSSQRLL